MFSFFSRKILSFLLLMLLFLNAALYARRSVSVAQISGKEIGCYETLVLKVIMHEVTYNNPYNPDEVDLKGVFISPSARKWQIFGYYDNYQNRNEWKVKFTPNETGIWKYFLTVTDTSGIVKSKQYTFIVKKSNLHGWIKVSSNNPCYFEYDDGMPFYGIGLYYPWHVNSIGLDHLHSSGANLFAYWNITWDCGIIESLESGLGRYDQRSCARIDQIIGWAEERNMKMMLAIWPHDLLAGPVLKNTGWGKEWDENPYKQVTSARGFYSSEEAWRYQQKQYRYIIARWGSSRSMGIWEIVNEINGTDGGDNTPEALTWVKRVDDFFKNNDPYQHPTTANQSGGRFWTDGYKEVDIPTVHVYENQFNINPFPDQPLRSSYMLYYKISQYFRENFKKPAFMGEAGFTAPENVFGDFTSRSAEYDTLYHNALWSCWAGGNAATPMWWEYGSPKVVTPYRLKQLKIFADIISGIDYAHIPFSLTEASADNADVFAMSADTMAIGWMRDINSGQIKSPHLTIKGLTPGNFDISWINPWTGKEIMITNTNSINGNISMKFPKNYQETDITFIIKPAKRYEYIKK